MCGFIDNVCKKLKKKAKIMAIDCVRGVTLKTRKHFDESQPPALGWKSKHLQFDF